MSLRRYIARAIVGLALLGGLVASRWSARERVATSETVARPAEFACANHHCGCSTREKCENACCCSHEHVASDAQVDSNSYEERIDVATLLSAPREPMTRSSVRPLGCNCGDSPQSIASSASGCADAPLTTSIVMLDPPADFELASSTPMRSRTKPQPPAPPPRESVTIV